MPAGRAAHNPGRFGAGPRVSVVGVHPQGGDLAGGRLLGAALGQRVATGVDLAPGVGLARRVVGGLRRLGGPGEEALAVAVEAAGVVVPRPGGDGGEAGAVVEEEGEVLAG